MHIGSLMKQLFTLLVALFAFSLSSLVQAGSTFYQQHGEWASMLYYGESNAVGRIVHTNGNSILLIDYGEDTNLVFVFQDIYTSVNLNRIKDKNPTFIPTDLRVDKKKVYSVQSGLWVDVNTRTFFIYFPVNELGKQFFNDLETGNTLRIRVGSGRNAIIINIPLAGFAAASHRAKELYKEYLISNASVRERIRKEEQEYFN